jgi:hypothetical protein
MRRRKVMVGVTGLLLVLRLLAWGLPYLTHAYRLPR